MTTSRDNLPSSSLTDEEYGALRASASLWAGTSVLATDTCGRVLVQKVDYRPQRLLPGGAVDPGEAPSRAASRELQEELGVTMTIDRGLAVDWVPPTTPGLSPALRFPGELLFVYDGGTWDTAQIDTIRLPEGEVIGVDFVEPADLPDLMSPGDARRALAALRARTNGAGTVLLEDGHPLAPTLLDHVHAFSRQRATHHWPWHPEPVPAGTPVRQCWGWLFTPDGRVLVLLDPSHGASCLPGGTPEPQDQGDPAATLIREAVEEAAVQISTPVFLGHLWNEDPDSGPYARVRMAATRTNIGPSRPDPATGQTYIRALATPEQVIEMFNWGPAAIDQLAAVHRERVRLGLPRASRRCVTLIPDDEALP
ncbi:NUDIX hydrolase [Streptomyces sp. NPDC001020]